MTVSHKNNNYQYQSVILKRDGGYFYHKDFGLDYYDFGYIYPNHYFYGQYKSWNHYRISDSYIIRKRHSFLLELWSYERLGGPTSHHILLTSWREYHRLL